MKKYIFFILTTLAVAGSSCKKTYLDDLQVNPNSPSVTTPNLALAGALKIAAGIPNGNFVSNGLVTTTLIYTQYAGWMNYLSYSTGFQPNVALIQYQFTQANYDVWTPLYANVSNLTSLLNSTSEPYYQAIAKIMLVYDFQQLVDNYNNVPYTQAIQGITTLNPTYDSGSAIYDDLLKQLDAAIVLIQKANAATAVNPGTADIIYKGNMTNWIKFANTLKLRVAIRQTNVTAKTAALKTAIAATSGLGYIDATNPATANPGYTNSDAFGGQQSPLWLTYGSTQSGGAQAGNSQYQANTYAANKLTAGDDVRGYFVYLPNASGQIVSTAFGATVPPAGTVSKLGTGVLKSPTQDAIVFSAMESLFLQAEAAKGGYITGSDKTFYDAAVTASFNYLGASATGSTVSATAAKYLNGSGAYPTAGTDAQKQQAIINEKWKALDPFGALEAFNEYRRTGYPNDIPLSIYPGANAPNQVTRIFYPSIEFQTNAANVAAQGTIDKFTSKIFWAK